MCLDRASYNGVKCYCGQEFGYQSYRVDETQAPFDGYCSTGCTTG